MINATFQITCWEMETCRRRISESWTSWRCKETNVELRGCSLIYDLTDAQTDSCLYYEHRRCSSRWMVEEHPDKQLCLSHNSDPQMASVRADQRTRQTSVFHFLCSIWTLNTDRNVLSHINLLSMINTVKMSLEICCGPKLSSGPSCSP